MIEVLLKKLLPLFLIGFVVSLLLVPPVKALLVRVGMVDKPSARRINKTPVPRGGGIAVFVAFHIAMLIWYFWMSGGVISPWASESQMVCWCSASFLLFIVGILDDAFGLKPLVKLSGQIAAAIIMISSGINLGDLILIDMPPIVGMLLTVVWYIIIINAFNLIDGLDGLASGLALIGAVGLTICLSFRGNAVSAVPLVVLAGVCLGFLRYNFNPASVFLGDTGSMFLGFTLATIPLVAGGKAAFIASVGVPLLVIGVPLFDTVLAIWRRTMRAVVPPSPDVEKKGLRAVLLPDMDHLHHRLLSSGLTQRKTAFFLYTVSVVLVLTAVLVTVFSNKASGFLLLGTLILVAILASHLTRVELWDTGMAILSTVNKSRFSRYLLPLYILSDIVSLAVMWFVSESLAYQYDYGYAVKYIKTVFPVYFGCMIGALALAKCYRRVWVKADAKDFVVLFLACFIGWVVADAVVIMFELCDYEGFFRQMFIFLMLSVIPVMLVRMVRVLVSHGLASAESRRIKNAAGIRKVLVYGAGEHFLVYETMTHGSLLAHRNWFIVGIVDDDPLLRGRVIRGFKVLGSIADIDKILDENSVDAVCISDSLRVENLNKMVKIAGKRGLDLYEIECGLRKIDNPQSLLERK